MTPRVRRLLTSLLSQLTLQPRTSGSEVRCEEVRISGLSSTTHIYMVSSCPTQYQDSLTERRCRRDVSSDYSYHLDIPVTSLATGRVYRNIFCAVCHQDGDSVAQQKISVRCDNLDLADLCLSRQDLTAEKRYVPGTLRWETRLGPQENCTDQLYVIKVCQMNLVTNDYPRVHLYNNQGI